jgi:hypothetical protein
MAALQHCKDQQVRQTEETYQLHLDVGVESRDVDADGVVGDELIYCGRKNSVL